MKRIYLDHAATTPLCKEAFVAMEPYFADSFGNADSVHSFGREGERGLLSARDAIAAVIGAAPEEICFTSGGTEADNFALKGAAAASDKRHIIVSATEHPAVRAAAEQLGQFGFDVTVLEVDNEGFVSPDALRAAMRKDTLLVSIMWANNVFGTLNDIPALAAVAHEGGALFHTDAVQAGGSLDVTTACGADMISFSAHKMYGPKGVGALYIRRGTRLSPLVAGGEQERGLRGGTSNVVGAVGFAAAFRKASECRSADAAKIRALRDLFFGKVRDTHGVSLVGTSDFDRRHYGNLCLRVVGVPAEKMLIALDLAGVAVSAGSACSARQSEPDRALMALGMTAAEAGECVRISLGRGNTEDDVAAAAEAFKSAAERLGGR